MSAPRCCANCDQGRKPCPTPASCQLPEPHHGRARMGAFKGVERFLLRHQSAAVAVASFLGFAFLLWATKP